jgi:hypothetical protein
VSGNEVLNQLYAAEEGAARRLADVLGIAHNLSWMQWAGSLLIRFKILSLKWATSFN